MLVQQWEGNARKDNSERQEEEGWELKAETELWVNTVL